MGIATITLNGRAYRLSCGEGEETRLADLSAYVNGKIDRLRAEVGQVGEERLLVMAAILLADELFETRDRLADGDGAARKAGRRARSQTPRPASAPEANDASALEPLPAE